jgi:hypothetical protein
MARLGVQREGTQRGGEADGLEVLNDRAGLVFPFAERLGVAAHIGGHDRQTPRPSPRRPRSRSLP